MTENDRDILDKAVRRVQSGQRDAFREIVEAMLPVVRAFVAGRSLPGVDVDEVVQRTFVEAYQGIGQYSSGTSLRAWLLTIARYQLMMEATRLKRLADYHRKYVPAALADLADARLHSELLDRTEGAIRKQLCLLRQQLHDCITHKLATETSHE